MGMNTSDIGLAAIAGKTTGHSRYSRVAIILHWTIAGLIIFNLAIGFVMEGFPQPGRFIAVVLHVSSGMTVLVLTVARLVWWMTHEPPPHLASLKFWEHRLARAVHLALYVAMVGMPLTGWAIISANPPPGSAGAAEQARQLSLKTHASPAGAQQPMPGAPPASPGTPSQAMSSASGVPAGGPQGGPPPGPPPRRELKVWGIITLPPIMAFREIGETAEGYEPQHELHEEFVSWHSVGAYLLLLVLGLHIAGALKHQYIDKEPELQRMGVGRRNRKV
jgi:cytochrome b561